MLGESRWDEEEIQQEVQQPRQKRLSVVEHVANTSFVDEDFEDFLTGFDP